MKGLKAMDKNITKDMLDWTIDGITLTETRKISEDEDAKKAGMSKSVELTIKYDGRTLGDILKKAYKSDCITWASSNRGKAIPAAVTYQSPQPGTKGARVDGVNQLLDDISGMTDEEALAHIKALAVSRVKKA